MVFDAAAWWEVLHGTETGAALTDRYLRVPGVEVLTVDLGLAEISAKLERLGRGNEVEKALGTVESISEVVPVTGAVARGAGKLLVQLRRKERDASLADAIMLATARERGAVLVSHDPCFEGLKDVAWPTPEEHAVPRPDG